jgi:hypothetical protein
MVDDRSTTEIVAILTSVSRRCTEQVAPVVLRFTADDAVALVAD